MFPFLASSDSIPIFLITQPQQSVMGQTQKWLTQCDRRRVVLAGSSSEHGWSLHPAVPISGNLWGIPTVNIVPQFVSPIPEDKALAVDSPVSNMGIEIEVQVMYLPVWLGRVWSAVVLRSLVLAQKSLPMLMIPGTFQQSLLESISLVLLTVLLELLDIFSIS